MFNTKIKNQLNKASVHIKNNELESAEAIYKILLNTEEVEDKDLFNYIDEYLNSLDSFAHIRSLMSFIKVRPKNFYFYQQLANRLLSENRIDETLRLYDDFERINPSNPNMHFNRALVLKNNYDFEASICSYQKAINLGLTAPQEACSNMALVYSEINKVEESESMFKRALELDPNYLPAKYNLAGLYEELGLRNKALELYEDILKQDPNYLQALVRCAYASTIEDLNHPIVKHLKRGLRKNNIDNQTRAELFFALGKVLDDCREYKSAFSYYQQANQICMNTTKYDLKAHEQLTEEIISFFTQEMLSKIQLNNEQQPIIICGMFRSGSSLLEQILAGHKLIAAAGELSFFPQIANIEISDYPNSLVEVKQTDLVQWAKKYLNICANFSKENQFVTDKRPDNFLYVGLIKVLFPNAKIIFTEREEDDNALSIYFQHLSNYYSYSSSLSDIRHYFSQYQKITSHWKELFGDDVHFVKYESLVSNLDKIAKSAIEFCGLPWDSQCLNFQQRTEQVKTASIWQVRQPIHKKSVGRWKNYEKYISVFNTDSAEETMKLELKQNKTTLSWERYWKKNAVYASYQTGSLEEEILTSHWTNVFNLSLLTPQKITMLDVACGNGVVTKMAIDLCKPSDVDKYSFYCTDFSEAALRTILKTNSDVRVVPADARQLPFMDNTFDLVVSQFGIEYAGFDAFKESVRVLKSGGTFACIFHLKYGAIYVECEHVLVALNDFHTTGFVKSAENLFAVIFGIQKGNASATDFQRADLALSESVAKVKTLFSKFGSKIANGVLFSLYTDIANMYSKMESYDSKDVIFWFEKVNFELDAYKERMSSMMKCAMSNVEFDRLKLFLNSLGILKTSSGKLENNIKEHFISWYYTGIKKE